MNTTRPLTVRDSAPPDLAAISPSKRPTATPKKRVPRPEAALKALLREDPALAERCLRLLSPEPAPGEITLPERAVALVLPLLAGRDHEALVCIALDNRCRVIDVAVITTGSVSATVVDPAQIFRWALTRSRPAAAIILAHNHPSGDPKPSFADRMATEKVAAAGRTLNVTLADHVVVADPDKWCSMAEMGWVPDR